MNFLGSAFDSYHPLNPPINPPNPSNFRSTPQPPKGGLKSYLYPSSSFLVFCVIIWDSSFRHIFHSHHSLLSCVIIGGFLISPYFTSFLAYLCKYWGIPYFSYCPFTSCLTFLCNYWGIPHFACGSFGMTAALGWFGSAAIARSVRLPLTH